MKYCITCDVCPKHCVDCPCYVELENSILFLCTNNNRLYLAHDWYDVLSMLYPDL